MENSSQHSLRRQIFFIFWVPVIILVAILCGPILYNRFVPQHWSFESRAELERIRTELPLAEARWNAHHIADYEIDAQAGAHLTFCGIYENGRLYFVPHHLEIRQNEIIFANDMQKNAVEECHIEDFLPPKVFETLRQEIKTADPKWEYLKVEFDPEYGFVSQYVLTANNRRQSDEYVGYTFTNFRPKQP